MSDLVFCRYCGKAMPTDSQFCPHCGKSQSGPAAQPAGGAAPSQPPPAAEQGLSPAASESKKGGTIPVFVWVIGGLIGLCCIGVAAVAGFGGSLWKSAVPTQTAAAAQTGLAEKWTTPFLALYIVERQYEDSLATFEQIEAGSLTRDEFTMQVAFPDAYDVAYIGFFRLEQLPAEMKTGEDVLRVDPSVQSYLNSLEDDYDTISEVEIMFTISNIPTDEAIGRLQDGQQTLSIERERMIQAAKSDGMTDEVYAIIQTSLQEQWPGLKEKFTDIGIRMMTPQP